MARLPDVDIRRPKSEVSLVRLVEAQGHTLRRQGKDVAIRCPFHEGDDTPSCVISPASNLFHRFACEAAGSGIDWVVRTRGVFFRFACEILQSDAGLVAGGGTATATTIVPVLELPLNSPVRRRTPARCRRGSAPGSASRRRAAPATCRPPRGSAGSAPAS